MNVARTVVYVLAVILSSLIAAGQQCAPPYPITVSSASLAPNTINGDGTEVALGHFQVHNGAGSGNVLILFSGNTPSFRCIPPSVGGIGPFGNGCIAVNSNPVDVQFYGSSPVNTTLNFHAAIAYPDNPAGCTDPGQDLSLSLTTQPTPPPPIDGRCPAGNCASGGAPINLTNGDTWIEEQDFSLPGLGGGITLSRVWNSLWPTFNPVELSGTFGHSWRSNFNERLQSLAGGSKKYWQVSGSQWTFAYDSLNQVYSLIQPTDEHAALACTSTPAQCILTFVDGTKKVFDSAGYLTNVIDRNGNQVVVSYDSSHRITQLTDAASRSITFSYADANNPNQATSVQDVTGTIATYTYDSSSRLTRVTYADSSQINFVYDSNSQITDVTDSQGKVLETHTYDSQRRGTYSARATVNGSAVEAIHVTYAVGQNKTFITNSFGTETDYAWTAINGRRYVTSVNGQGCVTCGLKTFETQSFSYYADGTTAQSSADGSSPLVYSYDSNGNLTQRSVVINSVPITSSYTYNNFAEVLTSTDPNGNTTTNVYDAKGNLTSVTSPKPDANTAPSVTRFGYDTKGQLTSITDPLNHPASTMAYFSTGLIQWVKDGQLNKTSYTYDARGNRLTVTDAKSNVTKFGYDNMNRLISITYPNALNNPVQFHYDYRGRRDKVTDQNGKVTQYAYDDADRLTSVTDAQTPAAGVTQYGYDTENNVTSITDAAGHQTQLNYDNGGQVTKATFPSTLFESYLNSAGDVIQKTDRKNQVINFYYDSLHRLTAKSYPDGSTITYAYDPASNLTQVTDNTGGTNSTYSFSYDGMNRLITTTTSYGFLPARTFITSYGYDAASNRQTLTDPENGVTTYSYDTLNRLTNIQDFQLQNYGFAYDTLSRRTSLTRPNGVNATYTYNNVSNLLSVLHQLGTTTLDGASYTYDLAGNRKTRTDKRLSTTVTYAYDNIYQLLTAKQGTTTKESYTYDLVGNRLSSVGVSPYSYNSSNQLTSIPGTTYTYDNNGNTKTKTTAAGTTTYTWDYENRLTQVTLPGTGGTVTFKYDPFGRRVQKAFTQGGTTTTTNYLYDGNNLLEEVDNVGNVLARYGQGMAIDEHLSQSRQGATSFYGQDGLGSVTSLSDSGGALAKSYSYDSFGKLNTSSGTLINPFQFTGRDFDTETGIYYYRHRFFDQNVGRFVSEDPLRFDAGVNFYTYVDNDPVDSTDPNGLKTYQCTAPLHAAPKLYHKVPLMYHEYLCVVGNDGKPVCGGQDRSGAWWSSDGKPSDDSMDRGQCKEGEPDNQCIEQCELREFGQPRPHYGIPFGTDCQEWADETLKKCRKECKKK